MATLDSTMKFSTEALSQAQGGYRITEEVR